jgi:hypothetical protein
VRRDLRMSVRACVSVCVRGGHSSALCREVCTMYSCRVAGDGDRVQTSTGGIVAGALARRSKSTTLIGDGMSFGAAGNESV